jgi:putative membrane protein
VSSESPATEARQREVFGAVGANPQSEALEEVSVMGWHMGMVWGPLLQVLILVALWAIIVATMVLAVRAWRGSTTSASASTGARRQESPAMRLLDERLARGEIDPEEYRRDRDLLASPR